MNRKHLENAGWLMMEPSTHGRMKLSELWEICEETRDSDEDMGAVHCPECQVVSFCYPGDYLCIVCRDEGERSEESRRGLAVHDPEDVDSLIHKETDDQPA